ncbi:MAG: hypothetical protein RLZZ54_718 [Cyanobacteriota bacterium]|jgi:hypothetical protein
MKELREWIQLAFAVIGGGLASAAFLQNQRQRRVENALKFVALFKESLREGDIGHWVELFQAASEPAGCPPGHFRTSRNSCISIVEYFSEGSGDDYAISRMANSLDAVCYQVVTGAADAQTVYHEIGQLLWHMNLWLRAVPAPAGKLSFLEQSFPNIARFFSKFGRAAQTWPSRTFAYIE